MLPDYMITFKDWYVVEGHKEPLNVIEEAFSVEAMPNKGSKTAEIFLGRYQPPHQGHIKIIKKMKNPIVIIVKGKKSSEDKVRNPLETNEQIRLLKKAVPGLKVIIAKAGYLPEIFSDLRESQNIEVTAVYAGDDRINDYKRQIDSINKKLSSKNEFDVTFKKTERFASATDVRKAIRDNDEQSFKKFMPKSLHDEFENLQGLLK